MTLRVRNPNFKSAEHQLIDEWSVAMAAYLTGAAAGQEFITLEDLKRDFPQVASEITEGRVEAVCNKLGLQVER